MALLLKKRALFPPQASPMLLLISTTCTSCPCAGAGVSMQWYGGSSCSSWASASSCYWLAQTALACFASSLPGMPGPPLPPHSVSTAFTLAPLSMGSNRVFTEGTCKLLTLVVTDLVDEDLVLNHRKQAASALLFGMVALVTKPGQTFAPLLGTWLLCFYTGEAPCPTSSGIVREAEGPCLALHCHG